MKTGLSTPQGYSDGFIFVPPGFNPGSIGNVGNDIKSQVLRELRSIIGSKKKPPKRNLTEAERIQHFAEVEGTAIRSQVNYKRPPKTPSGLTLYDYINLERIEIQFVPKELSYNINSDFTAIKAVGQNNPLYHYCGSEDTLEFELDWFAQDEDRQDVITKCKKIESLCKNDGYLHPPHPVRLFWGDILFSTALWIVTEASYKLSLPHKGKNNMFQQAYQKMQLTRITEENRLFEDIRKIES